MFVDATEAPPGSPPAAPDAYALVKCPVKGQLIRSACATWSCPGNSSCKADPSQPPKDATAIVSSLCPAKAACLVPATAATFGDPCEGCAKELQIAAR